MENRQETRLVKRIVVLTFVIIGMLAISLLAFVAHYLTNAREQVSKSMSDYLSLYCRNLDTQLYEADQIFEQLLYDNTSYNSLSTKDEKILYMAKYGLNKDISNIMSYSNTVDAILVSETTNQVEFGGRGALIGYVQYQNLQDYNMSQAKLYRNKANWSVVEIQGVKYVSKVYVWTGKAVGIYILLDRFINNGGSIDDNSELILADKDFVPLHAVGQPLHREESSSVFSVSQELTSLNSTLIYYQRKELVTTEGFSMQLALVAMLLVTLLVVIFARIYLVKILNHFLDEIVGLRVKSYEKQLLLSENELKAVKLQLRPHFFLNALTSISSLSMQGKNEDIQKFIDSLSKNVRYMFKSGLHTVKLEEELIHVENYFEMQELKFPGCVFYSIECEDSFKEWQIPQMLIHTIIENEYKYAVSIDSVLVILIKVTLAQRDGMEMLCIEIEDDGKGYKQEILDQFNSMEISQDGSRVGLSSLRRMLWLMYEKEDLFEIGNVSPHGCINRFFIPKRPVNEV